MNAMDTLAYTVEKRDTGTRIAMSTGPTSVLGVSNNPLLIMQIRVHVMSHQHAPPRPSTDQ